MVRFAVAMLLIAFGQSVAVACSPLPPALQTELTRKSAANIDKQKTAVVEAVVVRSAVWPKSGALRVTTVYWGKLARGSVILVQPQPGSLCGPGTISVGQSGFVQFANTSLQERPVLFYGFMERHTVNVYRARGLLKP